LAQNRLHIAKQDIMSLFDNLPKRVLKPSEIDRILSENREWWRLTGSTTTRDFLEFLMNKGELVSYTFNLPHRKETRYVWGEVSDYEVMLSLKPDCYLTHFTAMYLHELTLQVPKTIYINQEQPAKRFRDKNLTQERIDNAFRRPPRLSRNVAVFKDKRVCILNGMHTGRNGVIELTGDLGDSLPVTSIERTLIDITVRPAYSGGVRRVSEAYREARDRVSVNRLCGLLSDLNYIYPYHQAIGFYIEKSGVYTDQQIALLDSIGKQFDFYLTYQMRDADYSPRWRLFYPTGF